MSIHSLVGNLPGYGVITYKVTGRCASVNCARWSALIAARGVDLGARLAEVLKNFDSVVHMVVESMLAHGERIPEDPDGG
jgi:predicted RNase H-like HicB family nuclease